MTFNSKRSGNEVYHTIFQILLVKIRLCSKLQCQKVLKLKVFSCEITAARCRLMRSVYTAMVFAVMTKSCANSLSSFFLNSECEDASLKSGGFCVPGFRI